MHSFVEQNIMEAMKMNEQTIDKLIQMRLTVLAEEYQKQSLDISFNELSFNERLSLLVDSEFNARHNNKIERLIKNAHFSDSMAKLENIDYFPDRHINRDMMENLATNQFILDGTSDITRNNGK